MAHPPGWHPQPPPPPRDTNGWGRYVAATLEHILVRLHYIEKQQDQNSPALVAPTTKEPSWADRRDMLKEVSSVAKEVRTALMWIAVIVLLGGLIAKKIDLTQLQTLKPWLGLPG